MANRVISTRGAVLGALDAYKEELETAKALNERKPHQVATEKVKVRGLALNQSGRGRQWIGPLPGVNVGNKFDWRMQLSVIGMHRQPRARIQHVTTPIGQFVCVSIILQGRYQDDLDAGNIIYYTGQGGQDERTLLQREDQHWPPRAANSSLKQSMIDKSPVRVIRYVMDEESDKLVYRYDGLYDVVKFRYQNGIQGFKVYKIKLLRRQGQGPLDDKRVTFRGAVAPPPQQVPLQRQPGPQPLIQPRQQPGLHQPLHQPGPLPIRQAGPLPPRQPGPLLIRPLLIRQAGPLPPHQPGRLPVRQAGPLPGPPPVRQAGPLPPRQPGPLPVRQAGPRPRSHRQAQP